MQAVNDEMADVSLDFALRPRSIPPGHTTPPSTPWELPIATTPPALKPARMPILRQALFANSVAIVEDSIRADPEQVRYPFWEHGVEPPLCFALRNNCKVEVIELLLQHGADIGAKDIRGQSPANIVRALRAEVLGPSDYEDLSAIEKLLHVAEEESATFQKSPGHNTPADVGSMGTPDLTHATMHATGFANIKSAHRSCSRVCSEGISSIQDPLMNNWQAFWGIVSRAKGFIASAGRHTYDTLMSEIAFDTLGTTDIGEQPQGYTAIAHPMEDFSKSKAKSDRLERFNKADLTAPICVNWKDSETFFA